MSNLARSRTASLTRKQKGTLTQLRRVKSKIGRKYGKVLPYSPEAKEANARLARADKGAVSRFPW